MLSYVLVRNLRGEMPFRAGVYLIFMWTSMAFVSAVTELFRNLPPDPHGTGGQLAYRTAVGLLGLANFCFLLWWAGVRSTPCITIRLALSENKARAHRPRELALFTIHHRILAEAAAAIAEEDKYDLRYAQRVS